MLFTDLYNIVESDSLDGLLEDGFKDVFKPHSDDMLLKRQKKLNPPFAPLKPGDFIKVRKRKGVEKGKVIGWPYLEDGEWEVAFRSVSYMLGSKHIYRDHYAIFNTDSKEWEVGEGFFAGPDTNESFEDVFQPASEDELNKRYADVYKSAYASGMPNLKSGDEFKLRKHSKLPKSVNTKVAVSKIFISSEWDGEPACVVIFKNAKDDTYMKGALWREDKLNASGYWYLAFSHYWVMRNYDKVEDPWMSNHDIWDN